MDPKKLSFDKLQDELYQALLRFQKKQHPATRKRLGRLSEELSRRLRTGKR